MRRNVSPTAGAQKRWDSNNNQLTGSKHRVCAKTLSIFFIRLSFSAGSGSAGVCVY